MRTLPGTRDQGGDYTCRSVGARLHSGLNSGERSYLAPPPYSGERSSLAPPPYSGERSYLAPPPYNDTVCLSVSQNSTGGVGVDSNVTVCLCVSQNSTGGVGVDSNVLVNVVP